MRESYAIWTLAPNERSRAAAAELAVSMERVGLYKPLHVWSRGPVAGAITHELRDFDPTGGWYRLTYLLKAAQVISEQYLVWLDPVTRFEQHPQSVLDLLHGAPIHVPLTFALDANREEKAEWRGCPQYELVRMMRDAGVRNETIFASTSNFFVIHREAITIVTDLASGFARRADIEGWKLPIEPLLAYAMQMLCADSTRHLVQSYSVAPTQQSD
jgi:hypothetical protein